MPPRISVSDNANCWSSLTFCFASNFRRLVDELSTGLAYFDIGGETFTGDVGLINSFVGDDKIHAQFDFPSNLEILKAFCGGFLLGL